MFSLVRWLVIAAGVALFILGSLFTLSLRPGVYDPVLSMQADGEMFLAHAMQFLGLGMAVWGLLLPLG